MPVHKNDRPTLAPAFDLGEFARESDRRLIAPNAPESAASEEPESSDHLRRPRAGDAGERPDDSDLTRPSETRLVTRPYMGAISTNEAWARSMRGAPIVDVADSMLKRLPLDHRAGFLLSLMDGSIELETVVELCAMPRDGALSLIRDLYESGVIRFI